MRNAANALARRGTIRGPLVVLVLLLLAYFLVTPNSWSSYTVSNVANDSAALALAALGEGLIVLTGGFDLSVGAVLSLVNVLLATHFAAEGQSVWVAIAVGVLVGGGTGLVNGLFVVVGNLPSIIVTLGTWFIWSGVALLVLPTPGGNVSMDFTDVLTGSFGAFPHSLVVIAIALAVWSYLARTRFGTTVYALGLDEQAARMSGVKIGRNLVAVYVLSGFYYGAAGAFLTGQTSSGDPGVGLPLTLTAFAAVVVGGIRLGGGRGVLAGAVVGAFVLGAINDLLFSLHVSSFYNFVFNGLVLIVAVAATSIRLVPTLRLLNPLVLLHRSGRS